MIGSYYQETLSGERLMFCYDLAPLLVQRYLSAEIHHVKARLGPQDKVLELGCGYGRVMRELAPETGVVVGIDTSASSLQMARNYLRQNLNTALAQMNAGDLGFRPYSFDLVYCIQNGISAFQIDPQELLRSALSVTRYGGKVLFSSYAEEFWEHRLEWFRIQADNGLIGEIDESATGQGVIICKDGFRATTISRHGFSKLAASVGKKAEIEVVANSSVFCEITG